MVALNDLFTQARKTRLETQRLRTEMHALTAKNAAVRRQFAVRRQTYNMTARHAALNRERLPTWPAWSRPGPELRSTLVPLD